jgi:hypothetical protein
MIPVGDQPILWHVMQYYNGFLTNLMTNSDMRLPRPLVRLALSLLTPLFMILDRHVAGQLQTMGPTAR